VIDTLMDYHGNIAGDIAVTVLITAATVASVWNLAMRGHSWGGWFVALGFGLHAVRLWWTLATGGDPPISPIGLICLGFISTGWCLIAFRTRHALAANHPLAGIDDHLHRAVG
jgi:hypothetical protein